MQLCYCVQLLVDQYQTRIGQTIFGQSNKMQLCYCVQLLIDQYQTRIGQTIIGHRNKVAFCYCVQLLFVQCVFTNLSISVILLIYRPL